jgi:hypothetical protein
MLDRTKVLTPLAVVSALVVSLAVGQSQANANEKQKKRIETARVESVLAQRKEVAASRSATRLPFGSPSYNKQYARNYMKSKYGWGTKQYKCLVTLWNHESGWRVNAHNSSGAHGIPQALPGKKMASAGPNWRSNPHTQIKWGLKYIDGRYSTPCGALSSWNHKGWY